MKMKCCSIILVVLTITLAEINEINAGGWNSKSKKNSNSSTTPVGSRRVKGSSNSGGSQGVEGSRNTRTSGSLQSGTSTLSAGSRTPKGGKGLARLSSFGRALSIGSSGSNSSVSSPRPDPDPLANITTNSPTAVRDYLCLYKYYYELLQALEKRSVNPSFQHTQNGDSGMLRDTYRRHRNSNEFEVSARSYAVELQNQIIPQYVSHSTNANYPRDDANAQKFINQIINLCRSIRGDPRCTKSFQDDLYMFENFEGTTAKLTNRGSELNISFYNACKSLTGKRSRYIRPEASSSGSSLSNYKYPVDEHGKPQSYNKIVMTTPIPERR